MNNERRDVNARSYLPRSSPKRQSTLNIVGVIVLVVGLSTASIVLVMGAGRSTGPGVSGAPGDWQDQSLSIEDSKASSHDVEMYNGKLGLLALRVSNAFRQPESLAMIIATTSSLFALGCFFVSRRLSSGQSPENDDPLL
ncbi:MAG: hypothetical protein ABSA12_04495 [Verrucomicrobiia bacterium]|jgi:hypothetical protein